MTAVTDDTTKSRRTGDKQVSANAVSSLGLSGAASLTLLEYGYNCLKAEEVTMPTFDQFTIMAAFLLPAALLIKRGIMNRLNRWAGSDEYQGG